jgi:hypothetical protein
LTVTRHGYIIPTYPLNTGQNKMIKDGQQIQFKQAFRDKGDVGQFKRVAVGDEYDNRVKIRTEIEGWEPALCPTEIVQTSMIEENKND